MTHMPSSLFSPLSVSLRYVKSDFIEKQELTFEEVNLLNKLNIELCQHLNNETGVSVFQPFQHGNFTCVLLREVRERRERSIPLLSLLIAAS